MSERPLRVLQFIEGGGRYGAAVSVLHLTGALVARGVDVRFAVFAGRPLAEIVRERGVTVHEVRARRRYDFRGIAHTMRLLREERVDVLHTHLSKATLIGTVAARLSRVPVVSTVHGMNKKYSYLLADHVITVSEAGKRHLVDQGVPARRITAIHNGIDMAAFEGRPGRGEARARIGESAGVRLLGTVSRAEASKGIPEAIGALAQLRAEGLDARYLLVGDGRQLGELRGVAAAAGVADHVRFAGYQENIPVWLSALDVFLFPTKQEAFGISLIEAMACGLPVVTTRVGGVPEVVDDSCALFVDTGDAAQVAAQAARLLRDPALARSLGEAGLARVRSRFTTDVAARRAEEVYRRLLAEAASGRAAARPVRESRVEE